MEVFPFCPSESLQPVAQLLHTARRRWRILFEGHDYADVAHSLTLLRARRERPRGRCPTKQRDELASFHSLARHELGRLQQGTARIEMGAQGPVCAAAIESHA